MFVTYEFLRQIMIIGYARVSTKDQNLDLQIEALKKAGCEKIYKEKVSGTTKERPELDALINHLRVGDTIIVWKLDRLGRSLKNIIELVLYFSEKQIIVRGLTDGVDTSTSNGRLFLNIMASLAEYERELIKERTVAGLSAAKARGRLGGRPKGLKAETVKKLKMMRSLLEKPDADYESIYSSLGISRANFYRYLKLLDKHSDNELNQLRVKEK
jgi:DNA invertase Pin-like site-specific DNA recombinase